MGGCPLVVLSLHQPRWHIIERITSPKQYVIMEVRAFYCMSIKYCRCTSAGELSVPVYNDLPHACNCCVQPFDQTLLQELDWYNRLPGLGSQSFLMFSALQLFMIERSRSACCTLSDRKLLQYL